MFPSSTRKVGRTYARQSKRPLYDGEPCAKRRRVGEDEDGRAMLSTSAPGLMVNASSTGVSSSIKTTPTAKSSSPATSPPTRISEPSNTSPTRIPTISSSPQPSPPPSSDAPTRSSPPSSPTLESSPPPDTRRRPVFSLFKRKLKYSVSAPDILSERSHNAQSPPKPLPKKKRMVQMQLDLAGQHRKACTTCGMEYIPSNAQDVALHNKFHAVNFGGVDCTKAMVERLRQKQIWSGGEGSFTAVVGRRDALALRNKASDVLKVVNTELAAVPITDEELWSQTTLSTSAESSGAVTTSEKCDRYKVYLHIRGQKCVAACLAERIQHAYTVLPQDRVSEQPAQLDESQSVTISSTADKVVLEQSSSVSSTTADKVVLGQTLAPSQSSSISISTTTNKAVLGISRIWVSSQFRKQGVARRLLDCTRSDFMYGLTVKKDFTAFSQPTESGGKLARRYFGSEAGWHVYMD